jgi:hypothetical protein
MVLDNIEKLLEKYDNGATTLQEEQQLKNYFTQETVAPHLEVYKPMFQYFVITQEEQFTKDIPLKPSKTYTLYKWISVAAVAVLMFGVYTQVNKPITDLSQLTLEQQEAYFQTKKALAMVSSNFNEGASSFNTLKLASKSFEKGAEQMNHISEFSKATNKVFKTN